MIWLNIAIYAYVFCTMLAALFIISDQKEINKLTRDIHLMNKKLQKLEEELSRKNNDWR